MLLSLFTPTHKFDYLLAAYQSLCANVAVEGVEWEWVLLLNNIKGEAELPPALQQDPRVKIYHGFGENVGSLKREACRKCTGDWLLEFDHDDLLFPHALKTIAETIQHNPAAVFIYSDAVHFYDDKPGSEVYARKYGWESYPVVFQNKDFTALRSFPANPSSLYSISSAPDHIRCWRREFYEAIGGHDVTLKVCDDLDLLCRTYLSGGQMVHIPDALYMYRVYSQNSYRLNQQLVYTLDAQLGDRYRHKLVAEWCRRDNLAMLDLGGAFNCPPGYTAVDLQPPATIIRDVVRDGLPTLDELDGRQIGCIRAVDFLEHVPACGSRCAHTGCVVSVMNDIYDRLVPGGWLLSQTPSTDGRGAFQDPTHVSFWNANSWWYYCNSNYRKYVPGIRARFQPRRIVDCFPSEFHQMHKIAYVIADVVAEKGQPGIYQHWPNLEEPA